MLLPVAFISKFINTESSEKIARYHGQRKFSWHPKGRTKNIVALGKTRLISEFKSPKISFVSSWQWFFLWRMSLIPMDRIKRVKFPSGRSRLISARTNTKMHRPPQLRTLKESPHSKSTLFIIYTVRLLCINPFGTLTLVRLLCINHFGTMSLVLSQSRTWPVLWLLGFFFTCHILNVNWSHIVTLVAII